MYSTTLAIAILGVVLVWMLRPPYALAAFVTTLVWYPHYLRISIGTIDLSVGRIVVAVLLLRCLCDERMRGKFVWSRFDTWVALSMAVFVGVYCLTYPPGAIENRCGFLMDTWLTYIAVRLIVTDRATLISFIKVTSIVLVFLAILGMSECITNKHYFLALKRFRSWDAPIPDRMPKGRWGLGRANGPFSHSIMFGSCFAMFLPLIWALRHQRGYWGKLAYLLTGMVALGALSSMSSGPWVMLIAVIFCMVMEKYKHWVKLLLIGLIISCIVIGIISNRPFYHVLLSYANPVGGVWYQRAKLVDSAIEDFDRWWLAGYGGMDPGWGHRFYRSTDGNNEFIVMGIRYGLLGVIVLCAVLITAFRGLLRAARQTADVKLKSLYWSLGCVLVGVIVVWQGASFFGQMPSLFYSILGIIGSSFAFAKSTQVNGNRLLGTNNSNPIWIYR
ncbi:MAG: hypothetical protein ACYS80_26485 [Planctomycetota bacterium]|jgi:hypothetical protein